MISKSSRDCFYATLNHHILAAEHAGRANYIGSLTNGNLRITTSDKSTYRKRYNLLLKLKNELLALDEEDK